MTAFVAVAAAYAALEIAVTLRAIHLDGGLHRPHVVRARLAAAHLHHTTPIRLRSS